MRLLHVTGGNIYGGIERMIAALASTRTTGVQQCVAVSPDSRLSGELTGLGCHVAALPWARASRPLSILKGRHAFASLLDALRPDAAIFHGAWAHAMFARTARAHGAIVVFWQHTPMSAPGWLDRWAGRTPPDIQIVNSRFTAAHPAFPALPSQVIYCAVTPADPAHSASRTDTRAALGASHIDTAVLMAARLEAWKGHAVLIDAARLLRSRRLKFWIAGGVQRPSERAYAARLEKQVAAAGLEASVSLLGERRDIPALMSAADVYCQPNTAPEPFGLAIAEAMHAKLPCVVSRAGGAIELVNERCGCLAEPGDAHSVAAAIARLADDSDARERMGRAAALRAVELTDPRRRLADLLHLVAAHPQPAHAA